MTPTQTVESGDLSLAVYTWGDRATGKPIVVLVHGYPDAASVWDKTAPLLAEKYFVVAYDVRGAGRSDVPDHTKAYSLDHLVEDLAAVIEATCGDEQAHLICHDWGSIQSWEAVTTERIGARIASYTSISGPSIDHASYWIMNRLRSGSPKEMAQVARQLSHSWYIGAFQLPVLGESLWKLGLDKLWPTVLKRAE
ncbi:MAG: alpha/beta fold hydrolase, partial [Panacagrimonas sp.]